MEPHLVDVRMKLVNSVAWTRRVLRKEWGLRQEAVCSIYKGLWVACVLYGTSAWGSVCVYEYGKLRLHACQRVVLRMRVRMCVVWSPRRLCRSF